jgi:hypothetical protein
MGNLGDVDKAGWHLVGVLQLPISQSPIHLRFDAMYGQTSHKSPASGNTTLTGGTADLLYHLGDRAAKGRSRSWRSGSAAVSSSAWAAQPGQRPGGLSARSTATGF